jgi:vacuolar-type H+-ATPase subunit E/Vma4
MKVGIQAILHKINADAEELVRERHERIKADIDAEIEMENALYREEYEKRREMLEKHQSRERARLLERLDRRLRRDILSYQYSLINEIFDMTVSKLRDASADEFLRMFRAQIKGLKGEFTVHLGEHSRGKLYKRMIEDATEAAEGLTVVFSPEAVPHKSGFVLMDDRVEYNCLFEDLLDEMKSGQLATIFKEVFHS